MTVAGSAAGVQDVLVFAPQACAVAPAKRARCLHHATGGHWQDVSTSRLTVSFTALISVASGGSGVPVNVNGAPPSSASALNGCRDSMTKCWLCR